MCNCKNAMHALYAMSAKSKHNTQCEKVSKLLIDSFGGWLLHILLSVENNRNVEMEDLWVSKG